MDWILDLVSDFAVFGSLALLGWGAALCLGETLVRDHREAARAASTAGHAQPAHAGGR